MKFRVIVKNHIWTKRHVLILTNFLMPIPIYVNTHVNENKEFVFLITIPSTILKSKFQKIIINYIVFSNGRQYLYNNIEQRFSSDYMVIYQD